MIAPIDSLPEFDLTGLDHIPSSKMLPLVVRLSCYGEDGFIFQHDSFQTIGTNLALVICNGFTQYLVDRRH